MANKIGRRIKNATAMELAERGLLDEGYTATNPGLRAFVLEDASYLTEIRAKTWVLWRSKEAYEDLMASVVTGRASDPVLDAVGTPEEFIRRAPELASQLRQLFSGDSVDWASALAAVDCKVVSRTGSYWTEEPERLRMLIAFVGEFLREQKGWTWATDSGDGVILEQPGGRRASPGRVIVAQADEARKGEFALNDVLEELEQTAH